jgi:hypothetical protein
LGSEALEEEPNVVPVLWKEANVRRIQQRMRIGVLMTPKWRRSIVVPFNIEKVVKPTRS